MNLGDQNHTDHTHDVINGVRNDIAKTDFESVKYLEQSLSQRLADNTSNTETITESEISTGTNTKSGVLEKNSKLIHILILALIQNLIFILLDVLQIDSSQFYTGNIFLPLIAYDIYFYIFHSTEIPYSIFLNLLFTNYLQSSAKIYVKLLICVFQMMQDMMIYFFTFIVLYKSLIVIK